MTEIEESRAKRVQAQAFLADAYMQMEGARENSDEMSGDPKADFETAQTDNQKRKLKVEKSD
jgi:hypothetical protein